LRQIPEDGNLHSNCVKTSDAQKFKIKSIIYMNRLKQLQNTSIRKYQNSDCQTDFG